jgi:phosphatidylglycerophosphate synthase
MSNDRPAGADGPADATLPNLLSLSRIPMAAALWGVRKRPGALLALMAGAAITDLLDGWFARRHLPLSQRMGLSRSEGTGAPGEWLDPLCDKVFVVSLLGVLLAERRLRPATLALIGLRDLAVVPLLAAYRFVPALHERFPISLRARRLGKLTTAAQFLTLGVALLDPEKVPPLARITAGLGLAAIVDYVRYAAAQQARRGVVTGSADPATEE